MMIATSLDKSPGHGIDGAGLSNSDQMLEPANRKFNPMRRLYGDLVWCSSNRKITWGGSWGGSRLASIVDDGVDDLRGQLKEILNGVNPFGLKEGDSSRLKAEKVNENGGVFSGS